MALARTHSVALVGVQGHLVEVEADIAQLWLARWLAECDQVGELRQRADAGNAHALNELAGWLATHHRFDELRELITAKEGRASLVRRARSWS